MKTNLFKLSYKQYVQITFIQVVSLIILFISLFLNIKFNPPMLFIYCSGVILIFTTFLKDLSDDFVVSKKLFGQQQNRIQIKKTELNSLPIKDIDEYLKEYETQYDYLYSFFNDRFYDAKKILENQEIISLLSNDDVDSLLEIEKEKDNVGEIIKLSVLSNDRNFERNKEIISTKLSDVNRKLKHVETEINRITKEQNDLKFLANKNKLDELIEKNQNKYL